MVRSSVTLPKLLKLPEGSAVLESSETPNASDGAAVASPGLRNRVYGVHSRDLNGRCSACGEFCSSGPYELPDVWDGVDHHLRPQLRVEKLFAHRCARCWRLHVYILEYGDISVVRRARFRLEFALGGHSLSCLGHEQCHVDLRQYAAYFLRNIH